MGAGWIPAFAGMGAGWIPAFAGMGADRIPAPLLSQGQALLNAIQGQAFAGMVLVGDLFSLCGLLMWFRVPGDH